MEFLETLVFSFLLELKMENMLNRPPLIRLLPYLFFNSLFQVL